MRIKLALFPAVAAICLLVAGPAQALVRPQQLRSHNGLLKTTFVAQEGEAMMAGKKIGRTMTYNGQFPGPTMVVHPGDRVKIKFVNKLSQETNFHFHGLHVSPSGNADNVLRRFAPGSTNQISVKIPHDHANGLFWYHPHLHGDVNDQVLRGMSGMISIEGGEEQIRSLTHYKRRQIALNIAQFDSTGTQVIDSADQDDTTATTTVNGRVGEKIDMRPGETEMWRIANMSNENFLKLNLEGHEMWIVGEDGLPTGVSRSVKEYILIPGSRVEVLIKAGKKKGSFAFRRLKHTDGFNTFPAQTLVTLNVGGKKTTSQPVPHKLKKFEDLSREKADVKRKWILTFGSHPFTADINGKVFDPNRVDTQARIGSVEEWEFVNQTTQDHPMHLHTNDFQLVELNGKPFKANGHFDNVNVPRSGSVKIRFKPQTYTGLTVFHCHILFHEDKGMMATIRYVKGKTKSSVVHPAGSVSVHDQAVAEARVFNAASTPQAPAPVGPDDHDPLHTQVAASTDRRQPAPVGASREPAWYLCRPPFS